MVNTDFTEEQREFIRGCIYDELIDGKGGKVFYPRNTQEWETLAAMLYPLHYIDYTTEWKDGERIIKHVSTQLDDEGTDFIWDWFSERTDDALQLGNDELAAKYLGVINAILKDKGSETYESLHQWAHSKWEYGQIIPLDDNESRI